MVLAHLQKPLSCQWHVGGCMHIRSITFHSLWPRRVLVLADLSYHWRATWAKPFHGVTTSYFPPALCYLCRLPSGKWTGQHALFPHIYGMLRRSIWESGQDPGFSKTFLSKDGCRNNNWNSHCGQAQPFPSTTPSKYCESSVIWSLQKLDQFSVTRSFSYIPIPRTHPREPEPEIPHLLHQASHTLVGE